MNKFDQVAADKRFAFFGNVRFGCGELTAMELLKRYDGICLAYGASKDNTLNIPNEDKVIAARDVVGWYNGDPSKQNIGLDLTKTNTAIIIGNGNVALDIGRTLLSEISHLETTDITENALNELRKSKIKTVKIVGRRGLAQVLQKK
jgi:adrenodoxin-NADP+ reductase